MAYAPVEQCELVPEAGTDARDAVQYAHLMREAQPDCLLAEQLINNSAIGALMPALIGSNGTSDLAQDLVTILLGMSCSCAMRDLGSTLLE